MLKGCAGVGAKGYQRRYCRKEQEFEAACRLIEMLKLSA
jgi:hypothetical protein